MLLCAAFLLPNDVYSQCVADAGSNVTVCAGSTVILGGSPTAIDATVGVTYFWSSTETLSDNTAANPSVEFLNTGIYSFTVTLTSGGCDGLSDIVTVTVVNEPTANFTFLPNNSCANVPIEFTNTSSGCIDCSYEWDFGDGSAISTLENPTHTFSSAVGSANESFTVVLTTTEGGGCSGSQSYDVTVQQIPDISLVDPIADFTNCIGNPTFDLSVSEELSPTNVTQFSIDWGDLSADWISATAPNSVSHTYSGNQVWDLVYSALGNNGCTASQTYEVANITNPSIGVANPGGTQGCGPLNICFPLNNYAANDPSTYYVVHYGDGTENDTLSHPPPTEVCHVYDLSHCADFPSGYTFSITAINNCDVSVATIFPIRVYTTPQAGFVMDANPACVNSTVTFSNISIPGYNNLCSQNTTYTWDFGDGSPDVIVLSNAAQSHTYVLPGTYTVSLTATNSCGSTTVNQGLCIEPPITAAFNFGSNEGCVPFVVSANNTSAISQSCQEVEWLVDYTPLPCSPVNGAYSYVGATNANSLEPQFSFDSAGTFYVILQINNSCGNSQHIETVTVNSTPNVQVLTPSSSCVNTPMTAFATVDACNLPIISYNWSFPGGTPASGNSLVAPDVSYSSAGNFNATLMATNECGSSSDSGTMTVLAVPDVQITASDIDLTVCSGSNTILTATGAASYVWSPDLYLNTTFGNQVISSPTEQTSYTVIGTSGSCIDTGTITLDVVATPSLSAIEPFYEICAGELVELQVVAAGGSGVYSSYQWNPDSFLSNNSIANPICSAPSSQTYEAFVFDDNGCIGFTEVPVIVNDIFVNAGDDFVTCNIPVPIQLNGEPIGGVWAGPNITSLGVFTPAGVGDFIVSYTYTDPTTGCTKADPRNITVVNPAQANAGPDIEVCFGSGSINLAVGGVWSTESNVTLSPGGLLTPDFIGSHELVYTIGECASSDTIIAVVLPPPTMDAGADVTICAGDTIQLNTFQSDGEAPYEVFWNFAAFLADSNEPSPLAFPTSTITFTATLVDNNGCFDTDQVIVFVNPLPNVNAGPDAVFCDQPNAEVLSGFSPANGPGGTGVWSGIGITDSSGEFTSPGVGTYWLYYEFTGAFTNCSGIDSMQATVIPSLIVTGGPDVTACYNDGILQLIGYSPAAGGVWSGPGLVDGISGTVEPEEAGVGIHTLTFEFGSGSCLSTDEIIFEVLPLPAVTAGPGASVCEDSPTFILTGFSPSTGGVWEGFGIVDPLIGSFNPIVGAGNYEVFYWIEDLTTGCADSSFTTVNVLSLPNASFVIAPQVCSNVPLEIENLSSGATTYNWDFGNGDTSIDIVPSYAYPESNEGQNTISLTVTNDEGCSEFLAQSVEVVNAPEAIFETNAVSGCSPLEITFDNLSSINASSFQWDFGDDTGSNLEDPEPVIYSAADEIGLYDITLFTENFCGVDDSTLTIAVFPNNSEAYFDENVEEICLGLHIGLALNLVEPEGFNWSVSVFSENANVLVDTPLEIHSNSDEYFNQPPGNYLLVISTEYEGCSDATEAIPVIFGYCSEANVFLPKCFTPNGDGINDALVPVVWGIQENSYEFIVTNRERNVVFRSTTVGEGWDGFTPDQDLESQIGVYFYQILYQPSDPTVACQAVKDGKCEKLGHVTIVR